MALSRPTRFLTLLLAAMQFAVPAVVSVVDGASARAGLPLGTHIEEFGQNQCKPPHSADCAICQFLITAHSQAGTAVAAFVASEIAPAASTRVALCSSVAGYGFDSRAPPTS